MPAQSTTERVLADRYRVLRRLGVGGAATVYLAEDERLGRPVAVKRLHADSPADIARRFHREARLLASLSHPNVVAIYDTTTDDEGVLIVMEYVEGETLRDALGRGPLGPDEAIEVIAGVAAALDHAHVRGVVHRDVKPANVLLGSRGGVKLADLGIATASEATQITGTGSVLGTPAYMAPEQVRGGPVTTAVDVHALAVVAFEVLSGHKARPGDNPMQVARRIASEPPPSLRDVWPDAPGAAVAVLARGMARAPGERHATAGAFADDLARALGARVYFDKRPAAPRTATTQRIGSRAPIPVGSRGPGSGTHPGSGPHPGSGTDPGSGADPRSGTGLESGPGTPGSSSGAGPRPRRGRILPAAAVAALVAGAAAVALLFDDGGEESGGAGLPAPAPAPEERPAAREPAPEQPAASSPAPAPKADGPAEGRALNDEGFALIGQGRHEEAVPILRRAVEAFPEGTDDITYAYALYNLGHALRLSGRPEEAVDVLERRLEIPNQTGVVRRELRLARAAAGEKRGGDGKKRDGDGEKHKREKDRD